MIEDLKTFWKCKKVFITGHTGFKGSWLTLWLHSLEAHIIGFALPPETTPNLFSEASIDNTIIDIRGDIRDYDLLKKTIFKHEPEIIFHLAAQPLVRPAYKNPLDTFTTNVLGTVHVLEAARACPSIRAIVNVTTDKCYKNNEWLWGYREDEPLGGKDPYSSSKACSELITRAYEHSFFNASASSVGIASARGGNVIGGGDWAQDRLMTDIIKAVMENDPLTLRYPEATRPWQHVFDALSGYLTLAQKLYLNPKKYSGPWNFGPNLEESYSVRIVVEKIFKLLEKKPAYQALEEKALPESQYLKLDCTKSRMFLNWYPRFKFTEALEATIKWYQAYYKGDNMREFSLMQLQNYQTA